MGVEALNSLILSCADMGNGGKLSKVADTTEAESDILLLRSALKLGHFKGPLEGDRGLTKPAQSPRVDLAPLKHLRCCFAARRQSLANFQPFGRDS